MGDLAEYGAGMSHDDLSDQEILLMDLSKWLMKSNDVQVYSQDKQDFTHGEFSSDADYDADLIVSGISNNYVLQFTSADDSSNVHDKAYNVWKHWRSLASEEVDYSINGDSISIDAVLIATDYSSHGRLFHNRQNNDPLRAARSDDSQHAISDGYLSGTEHSCSETLLRMLWRFADESELEIDQEPSVGLGALYSSKLDESIEQTDDKANTRNSTHYTPAACYKIPSKENPVYWEYIPFTKQN